MANQYIKNEDAFFREVRDAFQESYSLYQTDGLVRITGETDQSKVKEQTLSRFKKSADYKRAIKDRALVDLKELSGIERKNAKNTILDSIYEHFTKTKPVATVADSAVQKDEAHLEQILEKMKINLGAKGQQAVKLSNTGDSITLSSFKRKKFDVDKDSIVPFTSTNKRPFRMYEGTPALLNSMTSSNARIYKKNVNKLISAIEEKYAEEEDETIEYINLDLTNIFDKTSMDDLNKRGAIYDYWKEIYDKFEDKSENGFIKKVEELVKGLKAIRKAPDENFQQDLENFIGVTENLKNLNYVVKIPQKEIDVGDVEGRAQKAINKFLAERQLTATKTDESGIDIKGTDTVTGEGKRIRGGSIGENLATSNEMAKVKDLGNKINLDPLTILYLKRDLEGIAEVFNDEDFKDTLREMFEDMRDGKKVKLLQGKTGEELLERLLDTHEAITSHDQKIMHLPIFMFKEKELEEAYKGKDTNYSSKADEVRETLNDFFRVFADLLEETRTTFSVFMNIEQFGKEPKTAKGTDAEYGMETDPKTGLGLRRYIYGQKGKEGKKRELTKVMKQLVAVGEMIGELFVAPMNLPSVNVGRKLPFSVNGHLRIISSIIDFEGGQGKIKGGGFLPYKVMSKMIRKSQTGFVKRKNLEQLIPFLKALNTGEVFKIDKKQTIVKLARDFKESLDEIYASEKGMEEIIDRDIASIFGAINKITNKTILEEFEGQNTKEAYEKTGIDNATEITPIFVLVDALEQNKQRIIDSEKDKTDEEKVSTIIDEFLSQAKKLTPMKKSELYYRLLEAHDSLRILKGKEIHYATRDENNFDHVEGMLIKMQQEYNLDMSAGELVSIVNEIDSFDNISKAHGINSEHVYLIKANFR